MVEVQVRSCQDSGVSKDYKLRPVSVWEDLDFQGFAFQHLAGVRWILQGTGLVL